MPRGRTVGTSRQSRGSPSATPAPYVTRAHTAQSDEGSSSADLDDTKRPKPTPSVLPAYFEHPPTFPSPFTGNLETSLDAIMEFNVKYPQLEKVLVTLLQPADAGTNWPVLIADVVRHWGEGIARPVLEELLFLVTRTLFPEQIAENRAWMAAMFLNKPGLAGAMVLRYDMLRQWRMSHKTVESWEKLVFRLDAMPAVHMSVPAPLLNPKYPARRPLMPNLLPTLVAPPEERWITPRCAEKMRHYHTALDDVLMLGDETVEGWGMMRLQTRLAMVLLEWQALRKNNATMEKLDRNGWEELSGKAENCLWLGDNRPTECLPQWDKDAKKMGPLKAD